MIKKLKKTYKAYKEWERSEVIFPVGDGFIVTNNYILLIISLIVLASIQSIIEIYK